MKKNLTLALFLACWSFTYSQTHFELPFDTVENRFDQAQAKSIALANKNDSRGVRFKLTNYNSVLYTPLIKVSSKRFKSILPDPVKSYVSLADFSRDVEFDIPLPEPPDVSPIFNLIAAEKSRIETELKTVNHQLTTITDKISDAKKAMVDYEQNKTFRAVPNEYEKRIEAQLDELRAIKLSLEIKKSKLEFESQSYREKDARLPLEETIKNFVVEYSRLMEYDEQLSGLFDALKGRNITLATCKKLRDSVLQSLSVMYSPSPQNHVKLEEKFQTSLNTCSALKESVRLQLQNQSVGQELAEAVDDLLISSEVINSKKTELTEAMSAFTRLFSSKSIVESEKYRHKNDYALLSIRLINNLQPKDTVLKQDLIVFTQNGYDVDFSIGITYDNIFKRTWYADTVNNEIKEEKRFNGNITWTGLVNFSKRMNYKERLGISIGAGLSLIDASTRYFAGLHYYYGARDLVGISAGLSFGNTNRLAKTFSENGTNPIDPLPKGVTEVKTYDRFASGYYVGIFYNFSRK